MFWLDSLIIIKGYYLAFQTRGRNVVLYIYSGYLFIMACSAIGNLWFNHGNFIDVRHQLLIKIKGNQSQLRNDVIVFFPRTSQVASPFPLSSSRPVPLTLGIISCHNDSCLLLISVSCFCCATKFCRAWPLGALTRERWSRWDVTLHPSCARIYVTGFQGQALPEWL